jgi:D-3-phosphoglycerate dehydrogenase
MARKVVGKMGMSSALIEEPLSRAGIALELAPIRTEADIIRCAWDADAILVGATEPYTARAIQALRKCRVLSRMGVGYDNIDIKASTDNGIAVAYVPGASVSEVSDHAMALLLAFARRIIPLSQIGRTSVWSQTSSELTKVRKGMQRIAGLTLGLVGMGRIGRALVPKAKAFGLRVITHDPYVGPEAARRMGIEMVDFQQLLKEADFISLHAPLTSETRHLFSMEQFRKMKPTACVINTARGALIDEGALATALKEGFIAGAALDVTEQEPLPPESALLQVENVMLTAHSAFYSDASAEDTRRQAVESILLALQGIWPDALVNPEVKQQPNRRIV